MGTIAPNVIMAFMKIKEFVWNALQSAKHVIIQIFA